MAGLQVADLLAMRGKVRDWADTTAVSDAVLTDLINMAVGKLANITRVRAMEVVVDLPITSGEVTLPADYTQVKYLKVTASDGDYHLERKSADFVDEYASRDDGTPKFFCRDDDVFRLAPNPDSITEATLCYYKEPPAMSADTDTNWFVTNAAEAVLFGSLWRLGIYVNDEVFAENYKAQFGEEAIELQAVEDKENWSGDTLSINP